MEDNFGKTNDNKTSDNWSKGPLTAVGLFLGVFGIAVLSGIFFTHTSRGKIINLMCGGILLLIGIIAIYNGLKRR